MWLIPESHWLIKCKKVIIFIAIFFSCMVIPIELQEEALSEIHHNSIETKSGLEIDHFELERDINFTINLYFTEAAFGYNLLEFILLVVELIFLLDIFFNCFIIKNEDLKKTDKPINSFK